MAGTSIFDLNSLSQIPFAPKNFGVYIATYLLNTDESHDLYIICNNYYIYVYYV